MRATRNFHRQLGHGSFDILLCGLELGHDALLSDPDLGRRLAPCIFQSGGALVEQFFSLSFLLGVDLGLRLPQGFLVLSYLFGGSRLRRLGRLLRTKRSGIAFGHHRQDRFKEERPHDNVKNEDNQGNRHSPKEQFADLVNQTWHWIVSPKDSGGQPRRPPTR